MPVLRRGGGHGDTTAARAELLRDCPVCCRPMEVYAVRARASCISVTRTIVTIPRPRHRPPKGPAHQKGTNEATGSLGAQRRCPCCLLGRGGGGSPTPTWLAPGRAHRPGPGGPAAPRQRGGRDLPIAHHGGANVQLRGGTPRCGLQRRGAGAAHRGQRRRRVPRVRDERPNQRPTSTGTALVPEMDGLPTDVIRPAGASPTSSTSWAAPPGPTGTTRTRTTSRTSSSSAASPGC
jgi:hypothetical protein